MKSFPAFFRGPRSLFGWGVLVFILVLLRAERRLLRTADVEEEVGSKWISPGFVGRQANAEDKACRWRALDECVEVKAGDECALLRQSASCAKRLAGSCIDDSGAAKRFRALQKAKERACGMQECSVEELEARCEEHLGDGSEETSTDDCESVLPLLLCARKETAVCPSKSNAVKFYKEQLQKYLDCSAASAAQPDRPCAASALDDCVKGYTGSCESLEGVLACGEPKAAICAETTSTGLGMRFATLQRLFGKSCPVDGADALLNCNSVSLMEECLELGEDTCGSRKEVVSCGAQVEKLCASNSPAGRVFYAYKEAYEKDCVYQDCALMAECMEDYDRSDCTTIPGVLACADAYETTCPNSSVIYDHYKIIQYRATKPCERHKGSYQCDNPTEISDRCFSDQHKFDPNDYDLRCRYLLSGLLCATKIVNICKSKDLQSGDLPATLPFQQVLKTAAEECDIGDNTCEESMLDECRSSYRYDCPSLREFVLCAREKVVNCTLFSPVMDSLNEATHILSVNCDPEYLPSSEDDSSCFPAAATVALQDGTKKRMDEVSIGDMVATGRGQFSEVFSWGHRDELISNAPFIEISSPNATITCSASHYLPINGVLTAAGAVQYGDRLELGSGELVMVTRVSATLGSGLFNPHTLNGRIVVNGVLASTYTQAVDPRLAHLLLAPLRLLHSSGLVRDPLRTLLHKSRPCLAKLAPSGIVWIGPNLGAR